MKIDRFLSVFRENFFYGGISVFRISYIFSRLDSILIGDTVCTGTVFVCLCVCVFFYCV